MSAAIVKGGMSAGPARGTLETRGRAKRRFRAVLAGFLLAACDWTEFDPLEDDAPVVALNRSSEVRGTFGAWIASATEGRSVTVLVGGTPGSSRAALYSLGTEQTPGTDTVHGGYCDVGGRIESCALANAAAPLVVENTDGEEELCYAYAWGQVRDSREGVLVRCRNNTDQSLPAPRGVADARAERIDVEDEHQPHFLAADRSERPVLLSGLPDQSAAWFHTAVDHDPVLLSLPDTADAPKSFGGQLAVMARADGDAMRLFAVAAPEEGQIWLFRSDDGESAEAVGCLGSYDGFGRRLAAGDVDGDGVDDLVVADDEVVTVFSGASLSRLPVAATAECGLQALPEDGVVASFRCGSSGAAKGCGSSRFGQSLGVGDLDGDGDGEVIVGAPHMTVYGREQAGAVLVYDAEGDDPHQLSDILYSSAAEEGDRLGDSLTTVVQGERAIVAGSAPGNGKVLLFYCSALLPEGARTGRCAN